MAGRGPAPKNERQRERDTRKSQAGLVTLRADGELRGPELPSSIPNPHPETRVYWTAWRLSAQAQLFSPTDWEQLKRGALLQDYLWKNPTKPSAAAASELRLLEERFGASYVDRQRARIVLQLDEDEPQLAAVTPITAAARSDAMARLRGETK